MSSDPPERRIRVYRPSLPLPEDPTADTLRLLPQMKRQLRAAELRAQRAMGEVNALRQVVSGLEKLAGTRSSQPELFFETGAEPSEPDGPRGQEAVRQVMLTKPDRDWQLFAITREVLNRGWIDPEAKVPGAAIRAAAQRLAAAGMAEKVAKGRYRLTDKGREDSG